MMPPEPIEIRLRDARSGGWLRFSDPVEILSASRTGEIWPALRRVEDAAGAGLFAAGFLSYEAAGAFDSALKTHEPGPAPLLWFALCRRAEPCAPPRPAGPAGGFGTWTGEIPPAAHRDAVRRIREAIARGDTYQANFTFRIRSRLDVRPADLFAALDARQQGAYSGFIQTPEFALLSLSPELFFQYREGTIRCRPMKGTMPRLADPERDRAEGLRLASDPKNRAENIMIVDMIRNDLGRIARPGSVRAERLFEVEPYPNVWQMTSTVSAQTDAAFPEILRALFPCASVTGAPKVSTMALIRDLETSPRGVYTGTLGFRSPDGSAQFNVAIRTLWLDRRTGRAEFGAGGGVVWDSRPEDEYEECLRKASILVRPGPAFRLLETMRWTPAEGYARLDRHLERLIRSAREFGFRCEPGRVRAALESEAAGFEGPARVRLLLDFAGGCDLRAGPLPDDGPGPVRIRPAAEPVRADDLFLRHKTTNREVYERARAGAPDCDDVLLWNERGEWTETCAGNVLMRLDGEWATPPVECGLLPGVYRAELLARGEIRERILARADAFRASAIDVINSVRGRRRAEWAGPRPAD